MRKQATKIKGWTVKSARVFIGDHARRTMFSDGSAFNHPVCEVTLSPPAAEDWRSDIRAVFSFQRHPVVNSIDNSLNETNEINWADGWTDTAERFTTCYGGCVELPDADKFRIGYGTYELTRENKVRVALATKLSGVVRERNLAAVHGSCELKQIVGALDSLRVAVVKTYLDGHSNMDDCPDLGEARRNGLRSANADAKSAAA